ncbi:uncharacterized protein BO80DRAFT_484260 [Aspergillus ibericus CBS 121593]|uniref:Uncharacterized protein n=1 Tax=Aspergillus ibericus CBS 121593 TaxID=1448316 RepID=A0A395GLX4_9EURO|nr:hypothetical protein BO80DRAFT_484260 [Aspergillus ibericus CBS 121593]RAK96511.1 hypothetical protein BO80DRAFT_484260 [Aspergillus ibericus CBS 121593]
MRKPSQKTTAPPPTYHAKSILKYDFKTINRTCPTPRNLWTVICTQSFPLSQFTQSEECHVLAGNPPFHKRTLFDCIVIRSYDPDCIDYSAHVPIFVVLYKDATEDTEMGWEHAKAQMLEYCRDSLKGRKRIYGVLAVGMKVRVCCCSYPVGYTSIEDGIELDLEDPADRCGLEEALVVVRERGWRWATDLRF